MLLKLLYLLINCVVLGMQTYLIGREWNSFSWWIEIVLRKTSFESNYLHQICLKIIEVGDEK